MKLECTILKKHDKYKHFIYTNVIMIIFDLAALIVSTNWYDSGGGGGGGVWRG